MIGIAFIFIQLIPFMFNPRKQLKKTIFKKSVNFGLKIGFDLYTQSTYTRVYTLLCIIDQYFCLLIMRMFDQQNYLLFGFFKQFLSYVTCSLFLPGWTKDLLTTGRQKHRKMMVKMISGTGKEKERWYQLNNNKLVTCIII